MNTDQEIVAIALEQLKEKIDFKSAYMTNPPGGMQSGDGMLDFHFKNETIHFLVECKKEVRQHHLYELFKQQDKVGSDPLIVIAERILPQVKEQLKNHNINYIEANGNAFIDENGQYILIDGAKPYQPATTNTNRAFTKTGLKVVFLLLCKPEFAEAGYREIALWSDTSLGNVTNVMNGLKETDHLLSISKNAWKLINRGELLKKWMDGYEHRLKPTLEMGRFRFLRPDDSLDWQNIPLESGNSYWGGEPAADLLTQHLRPEIFTLYTLETKAAMMKNYRLIPNPAGKIKVYKKFWKYNTQDNTAPPMLVYADLLANGDGRSLETAEIIYEQFLKPVLE